MDYCVLVDSWNPGFVGFPAWKADRAFELSYGAKIDSIKFTSGHRGHPFVLMNHEWRLLTIDEMKILPIAQVGDSLVKVSGARSIQIYRKQNATYQFLKSLE